MNTPHPILRPLTPVDTTALLAFYQARPPWIAHWFDPFPQPDSARIGQHLDATTAGQAISLGLCDSGGRMVGHGFILGTGDPAPVFGIGLREGLIGAGHGRGLMAAVMAEADRRNLPLVTLTVFKDNLRARRLYESFGFVVTGEWRCHAPGDSLAMRRHHSGGPGLGQRDAFLQRLNGRTTARRVWTADITYWIAGRRQQGNADPAWDTTEGFLGLHRDLGIMPYFEYSRFFAGTPRYDACITERWEHDGPRHTRRLATPLGELVEEHLDLPESACSGCTRHSVQSEADLDRLMCLLDHRRLEPANLDDYFARYTVWGAADGLPALGLPRSPLTAFCYEWAGIENTVFLLLDHENKLRRILELMEAQEQPVIEAVCRLAPPLVHFPDNLDSENLTGLYDDYLAPTHRRRLERLHAAGIRAAVHLDGAVRGLLPKLAAAGFDAVEALTPQPAGDIGVGEMAELAAGHNVILWGGVPGAMFAAPYTWEDMRRHVEHVMESWGARPFILGVADQVPPDGEIAFCRKIRDLLGGV